MRTWLLTTIVSIAILFVLVGGGCSSSDGGDTNNACNDGTGRNNCCSPSFFQKAAPQGSNVSCSPNGADCFVPCGDHPEYNAGPGVGITKHLVCSNGTWQNGVAYTNCPVTGGSDAGAD